MKTDRANPPAQIAPDHRVTVADMAAWEMPAQKITRVTPRFGRENHWFVLIGKVVLVKAEPDGDLHVQLGDPIGKSKVEVVVEVPVDNGAPNSAWSKIRKEVFGWSNQKFPFTTTIGKRLKLRQKPVIRGPKSASEPCQPMTGPPPSKKLLLEVSKTMPVQFWIRPSWRL